MRSSVFGSLQLSSIKVGAVRSFRARRMTTVSKLLVALAITVGTLALSRDADAQACFRGIGCDINVANTKSPGIAPDNTPAGLAGDTMVISGHGIDNDNGFCTFDNPPNNMTI